MRFVPVRCWGARWDMALVVTSIVSITIRRWTLRMRNRLAVCSIQDCFQTSRRYITHARVPTARGWHGSFRRMVDPGIDLVDCMRILLVEDDQRIARFVAKGLREHAFAVDVSIDGDDAIYKSSTTDYSAVILDVMIPGHDGFTVCRKLRGEGSAVPIIMLTARDNPPGRTAALDCGPADYLTHPF